MKHISEASVQKGIEAWRSNLSVLINLFMSALKMTESISFFFFFKEANRPDSHVLFTKKDKCFIQDIG